jgi:uncharacterized protein (TIGR01244 family)
MRTRLFAASLIAATALTASARGQVTKDTVPGVTNFASVETTVACGGVITPAAVAEMQHRGYKSVFDLQLRDEPNAHVDEEAAAAKAAGVNFVHVPFTPAHPDTHSVDTFLAEVGKPENQPAFIHCSGGNRAAGFWMIKRVLLDHWDVDKAQKEADALGLSSAPMKQFVLDYINSHKG